MPIQTEVQQAAPRHAAREPLELSATPVVRPIETNAHEPREPAVWLVIALMWLLFAFTFFLIWLRTKP